MTVDLAQQTAPVREPLYSSPRGIYPFQAKGVARSVLDPAHLGLWDTGTGKTHLGMITAAILFEDAKVDVVVLVAEQGKVDDWGRIDFPKYTKLSTGLYAGPRRKRLLDDPPQVIVMSYETGRNDICTFLAKRKAVDKPGPLTEFLADKRVLFIFDEVTKLRTRGSKLYLAWDYLINRVLRRRKMDGDHVKAIGLTATSIERNPEDHFNVARLLAPWLAPTVDQFAADHIATYDQFGNPRRFKNITRERLEDDHVVPLTERFAPLISIVSKDHPDVRQHFPKKVERDPTFVPAPERFMDFLVAIQEAFPDPDPRVEQQLWLLERMIVNHPLGLMRARGKMAQTIVQSVGEAGLRALGAPKLERMLTWAHRLGDNQGVMFTFYGQTVLPILAEELRERDYTVSINHGGLSPKERSESKAAFLAGDTQIFLSSDAGAKGLNLGCGKALLHYEPPTLYSTYDQRSNRIHRLDSDHPSVTIDMLVLKDTADEGALAAMLRRNDWSDQIVSDEELHEDEDPGATRISAAERRAKARRARDAA